MPTNKFTIAVFYAEEDRQDYYSPFKKHLDYYVKKSGFELNTIGKLLAGTETDAEIDKMVANAHIALLLLSVDLENCNSYERYKQQLLARHKQNELYIMPIYTRKYTIKHSDWAGLRFMPFQGKDDCNCLQDYFDKNKHDHICTEIITELGKIVLQLQAQPQPTSTPDPEKMNILVLSCAQNEILSKGKNAKPKKVSEWIMNQYGNTIGDWKPFKGENTIAELLAEYQKKSWFNIGLLRESVDDKHFFIAKNKSKIVAIVDMFALQYMEDKRTKIANLFMEIDNIGGLIIPLCEKADADLYDIILIQQKNFCATFSSYFYDDALLSCYIHIELNVPNKNELFRRLSNIAIGHLELKPTKPKVQFPDPFQEIQNKFPPLSLRNL